MDELNRPPISPKAQIIMRTVFPMLALFFIIVGLIAVTGLVKGSYSPGLGWLCIGGSSVSLIVWLIVTLTPPVRPGTRPERR
ncbi:MAG: hypothetical protein WD926_00630 [Patescibacteria group bacterium]